MTYQEYVDLGGKLSEEEFNELLPFIVMAIDSCITNLVPAWKIESSLEEYNLSNIDYLIRFQIDFISSCGGINAVMGRSDFDIKSVTTSGLQMQLGDTKHIEFYDGIPIAPLVKSHLVKELRKQGYLELGIW